MEVEDAIVHERFKLHDREYKKLKDEAYLQQKNSTYFVEQPSLYEIDYSNPLIYLFGQFLLLKSETPIKTICYPDLEDYLGTKPRARQLLEFLLTHRLITPLSSNGYSFTENMEVTLTEDACYLECSLNIDEFVSEKLPYGNIGLELIQGYLKVPTSEGNNHILSDMEYFLSLDYMNFLQSLGQHFNVPVQEGAKLEITMAVLAKYLPSEKAYRVMYKHVQDAAGDIRSGKARNHALNSMLLKIRWYVFNAITKGWEIHPLIREEFGDEQPTFIRLVEEELLKYGARKNSENEISMEELEVG